jgi:transcriptional regulator with XRE-family HTH domain
MKTFGDLLHVKRYENHLTLSQLAKQMGIAQTTVKAWEMDAERPDERQMEQLAKLLGFDSGFCSRNPPGDLC